MLSLLGGIFLGWSLGANDAANVFGTAVSSRMVRFWTAAVLAAVFVVAGAWMEGHRGIATLQSLTQVDMTHAMVVSVAAALTVTLMTLLGLPVSTSQAVVGAVLGIGILKGAQTIRIRTLGNILFAWIVTPAVACLTTLMLDFLVHLQYVPHAG
ncbi:Phosphate transporter family protein [Desulfacinum infernum DSM 9756]|uniref:Phosphate transporter family protein n=1 Tax=Desulfacinum infernum DSM 9756 TaxID=1121391 RepID=A0A1M5EXN3_9BACT|nr:inorganic phosphate transporter [Desulfacinum infernum]SHF83897.1 Phosphate transporter family protein [Desulfacinum infernum DSM 9756]